MTSWIPYVYVRIAIFFITGILTGISYKSMFDAEVAYRIISVLICLYLILFIAHRVVNKKKLMTGIIGLITVFVSGFTCTIQRDETRNPEHIIHISEPINYYQVTVTQLAQERERSWKFQAEIMAYKQKEWRKCNGRILIYLSKNDFKTPFHYGDVLIIQGSPQRVPPPGNPGEFDYRQFLEYKNIYHQHFLREGDVKLIRHDPPYRFLELAFELRVKADSTIKKFVHGQREQATASALVLGVTDGLDNELLDAYAATGAMHVLAVSGLHISIIYLILAFVLKPLKKIKYGHVILALISIVILWSYSFVTGLSPSVLRAVVMFTFMALAKASGRRTNIYNTLAAAAFALLVYDPFMIMSVGFQLSFLAVLGIVYVQPLLQRWWIPRSWILNEVWKVSCVSIAAQIVTFPLCLLYFHQFPNYFLLSNLFVIPGSFVVLLTGIAVLAFGFIESVGVMLGFVLEWTIRLLNYIVFTIESFPFSMIENISISTSQCWALMSVIVLMMMTFVRRKLKFLHAALVFGAFFLAMRWTDLNEQVHVRNLVLYKIPGHHAMDLLEDGHAYFRADSGLVQDQQKIRFHIRPNRQLGGVSNIETIVAPSIDSGYQTIVWHGKRIAFLTSRSGQWPSNASADFLIISNNASVELEKLPPSLLSASIILDSSNSFYFADKMLREAEVHKIKVYSVMHQGAYKQQL